MSYERDTKYIHPFITTQLDDILNAIQQKLPASFVCKLLSAHRTPEDQLKLFKQGREFKNGLWKIVDKSKIVTYKDGYINLSRHNYLPCTAIDIGIFDNKGNYQSADKLYRAVASGKNFGLDWGGDWQTFIDAPHLEIPSSVFFQKNIQKDNGYIWQQCLVAAGTYKGVLDGIFGPKSIAALAEATGESGRTISAWNKLYEKYGPPELRTNKLNTIKGDRPRPNPQRPRPVPPPRPRPGQ
jgi:hypothetical protein